MKMIIESLHKHYLSEVVKGNPLYPPAGMELKRRLRNYIQMVRGDEAYEME